jgi:hypothetical protein
MSLPARLVLWTVLATAAGPGAAQPWDFRQAMDVTHTSGKGVFHHLESSGRRNVAVSGTTVAVAWEDNHDGTPRIYLARKNIDAAKFDAAIRISGDGEAYEASLSALQGERFIVAWEEGGRIHARVITAQGLGPAVRLTDAEAVQANVSVRGDRAYVLRSQREGRFSGIRLQVLRVENALALVSEADCAVDTAPLEDHQFYPASAVADGALIAAWEDRRPGHTIIMATAAKLDDVCGFRPPVRISEALPGPKKPYGKGHGVARVAMGAFGGPDSLAVWADKRSYWEGYDIYSAAYLGDGRFGPNTRVQDEFGDFARQWHAAIAGNADGQLVVAWDDEREESSDVMLSWFEDGEWSEDLLLPAAAGAGQYTHPSIALDAEGNLHAAWIERTQANGPTRLRYQFGRITND